MAKKRTNVDNLKTVEPNYPRVRDTPAGYPPLLGIPGRTWYERAMRYHAQYGHVPTIVELQEEHEKERKEALKKVVKEAKKAKKEDA